MLTGHIKRNHGQDSGSPPSRKVIVLVSEAVKPALSYLAEVGLFSDLKEPSLQIAALANSSKKSTILKSKA
jgi:hypothetical protein